MSRRILQDVTRALFPSRPLAISPISWGARLYDFVTGRRGIDINQPTRLQSYAQLKLLLSLNASLDSDLRREITERLEKLPPIPLE